MRFRILFKADEYQRIMKATFRVRNKAKKLITTNGGSFNRICAMEVSQRTVIAITTQKYAGEYHQYTPRYEEWKRKYYQGSKGFWQLAGDVLRNVTHFKADADGKTGWMGGIPPGKTDRGGKSWFGQGPAQPVGPAKLVAFYAQIIEFGGGSPGGPGGFHRPRPLFTRVGEEYISTWENKAGWVLRQVGSEWV